MPEQRAERLVLGARGRLHVRQDVDAVADPLVLLRVVPGLDAVAERERARVGLGLPRQDPQQARLARAVQPQDEEPLAAPDVERDVA